MLEREIAALERDMAELDGRLEAAGSDYEAYAALYAEKEGAAQKLDALMARWEELAQEAEE